MDDTTLRKVQLVQLEIAKEVKRVCEENDIQYFLTAGTLLGAVRHKGFIPWDDDLDIGMLRKDYDKFCKIAPNSLDNKYIFQTWEDSSYPFPFGKVRKKGTTYIESKANPSNQVGIFIDILVYNDAYDDVNKFKKYNAKLLHLQRCLLMKCKYQPWMENGQIIYKKRVGYLIYQIFALFRSKMSLQSEFQSIQMKAQSNKYIHGQIESFYLPRMKKSWYDSTLEVTFEDDLFRIPVGYKEYLTLAYGDYMQLPPAEERENRHQILNLDFGETL